MKPIRRLSFLLGAAALAAAPALGQPVYTMTISSPQFSPFNLDVTNFYTPGTIRRYSTKPLAAFLHEAHPPNGALLQSLTFDFCDTSEESDLGVFAFSFDKSGGSGMSLGAGFTSGMPGCAQAVVDLSPANYMVDDTNKQLVVQVLTGAGGDDSTSFSSVALSFTRPLNPPTDPYFIDVPLTHPFFGFIQKMRQLGITGGTSLTTFSPSDPVTRGQMAVFIIRSLLRTDAPFVDFPTTPYFTDVPPTHPFFTFIQKMRQLGITSGCAPTLYCPSDPVTRGQMSAFIIRGLLNTNASFLDFQTTPYFTDVPPTHPFFNFIQKMRQLGITSGCSPTLYCPSDPVTRGQMSAFVMRALLNTNASFLNVDGTVGRPTQGD